MSRIKFLISLALTFGSPVMAGAQNVARTDLDSAVREITHTPITVIGAAGSERPATYKAIRQYGLASVRVGRTDEGRPVGYRLVLLATVPASIKEENELRIRAVIDPIIECIRKSLSAKIDSLPGLEQSAATDVQPGEKLSDHFSGYATNSANLVGIEFRKASLDFVRSVRRKVPRSGKESFLAIGLQPCVESDCTLRALPRGSYNISSERFGKIWEWMQSKGAVAANCAFTLDAQGNLDRITVKLDKGFAWHEDFPKPVLQQAFIVAVQYSRTVKTRLSYSAPELAGVPKEATAHVADVFDSAYAAAFRLPPNPNFILPGISDELGRARLKECLYLRGTFDPAAAGKCSGYNLTSPVIATCLSGGDCTPPFGNEVNLDSLTINTNSSLDFLAQHTALPRVDLGSVENMKKLANKCKTQGKDATYCFVKAGLAQDPAAAKSFECIHDAQTRGSEAFKKCATSALPKTQQDQITCFEKNRRDYKLQALCVARASLPPRSQAAIACASSLDRTNMKFQDAQSCFTAVGNKEAACLAAHKDHWADAALCIDGDRVPKPVRSAVSCLNKQPDNLAQFGICMVANEGDGEAQRIAACYVEAQGEPAAVAVCVAAPNLTLDQRIVLECAAETNGAVPATAACASGKMAVRELSNCQGKHFGDDDCFGESNEFRRAAKALGMEIGPHSVVGEVLNVQLRITDATSGPVLQVGTQALGDAVKIANDNGFLPDPSHPGSLLVPPGTGGIVRLGQEFWDGLTHFIPIF